MGHLEGQVTVFRSDVNDWVRPRSDGIQPTFLGVSNNEFENTPFFIIFDLKLSPLQIK